MKTRTDFVSNSSSSSYVFSANFRKYGFNLFVRTVCDQCDNGEDDGELRERNAAILNYCLRYFEAAYLGEIVLGRKKEIHRRGIGEDGKPVTDPNELHYTWFAQLKHDFIDSVPPPDDNNNPSVKMLSEDEIEYEYDEMSPPCLVVPKHYMSDVIRRHWSTGGGAEGRKRRVGEIMKLIEAEKKLGFESYLSPSGAATYLITKNTIANTRDLIADGYRVKLENWQDLDALEARLSAGETVFHIECGDCGEGEEDTRVFSLGSQYPFDGIPLENVRGSDW